MSVEIDDREWRDLVNRLGAADMEARVGWLASAGGGSTHDAKSGATNVEIALVHEYGSSDGHVPERAPIRRTFEDKRDEVADMEAKLGEQVVAGRMTMERAHDLLGRFGAGLVQKRIANEAPLTPYLTAETVNRKGSDRPLVNHGVLVGSISHEVVK